MKRIMVVSMVLLLCFGLVGTVWAISPRPRLATKASVAFIGGTREIAGYRALDITSGISGGFEPGLTFTYKITDASTKAEVLSGTATGSNPAGVQIGGNHIIIRLANKLEVGRYLLECRLKGKVTSSGKTTKYNYRSKIYFFSGPVISSYSATKIGEPQYETMHYAFQVDPNDPSTKREGDITYRTSDVKVVINGENFGEASLMVNYKTILPSVEERKNEPAAGTRATDPGLSWAYALLYYDNICTKEGFLDPVTSFRSDTQIVVMGKLKVTSNNFCYMGFDETFTLQRTFEYFVRKKTKTAYLQSGFNIHMPNDVN